VGLVAQGVVSALLGGLFDCDRPVALKACGLLINLREAVARPPATLNTDHHHHTTSSSSCSTATVATVTCELQWARLGEGGQGAPGEGGARSERRRREARFKEL